MTKEKILSGIQPSGRLHIGNYLGALKNFVDLQNSGEFEGFFFIADYHSLSEPPYEAEVKREQIIDLMKTYLAAGLDPKKSILFIQSQIPEHNELTWIFNSIIPMAELTRMTQFKDKAESGDLNVALFDYPALMAADILIYKAKFVPVGDDQNQHLELTRMIVRKFNARFGNYFKEPAGKFTEAPKIMSLTDPAKKMSKSKPNGCLFIDDDAETIRKKLSTAVTDSGSKINYNQETKPGISNLLRIQSALSGKNVEELELEFQNSNYADFKDAVAETIIDYFADYKARKAKMSDSLVQKVFQKGSKRAQKIAAQTLKEVKKKIGLL